MTTMRELINEGLRQRMEQGAAAALPFFEKAAQLDATSHLPLFLLGNAISELGDLDTAVRHYSRARDIQPREYVIRFNLGLHHLLRGYTDAAIEELRMACVLNPAYLPAQSTYIMALHNTDRVSPAEISATIRTWGARFASQHRAIVQPVSPRPSALSERMRVGFISGDFRMHSVAHFFEPVVSARNSDALEFFLYSNSDDQDSVTQRLRACTDAWRNVSQLNDDALIQAIHADRIDVLVDLSGHTAGNRLAVFARRAAPVQISYLGYPDTTGLPTMDYRMTDSATDPPFADAWHTERLLRLPGPQWCFRPFGMAADPGPLPARSNGYVTFGSFNQLAKISDTLLNCWVQILVRLPNSRLRLTRIRSPQRAAEIVARFEASGVAAGRIDCVSNHAVPPHGAQFSGVDLALDHYPYNGVTTTCESLYGGVPVVTLCGRNCVSRSGLSLLESVGLADLAAGTPQQYVDIALALARDLRRLENLRRSLRVRVEKSPLRDERRFAAHFEELLRRAWTEHLARPRKL